MSAADFILALVERVPSLKPLYEEHVNFYEEVLPHVFMGDLSKYLVSTAEMLDRGEKVDETLAAFNMILNYLEAGMAGGNGQVREMLAVSFLENLDPTAQDAEHLERRLGPTLMAELRKIRRA